MKELTIKEYAAVERVDERTVRRWIAQGLVRLEGGKVYPLADDLMASLSLWSWYSGIYFIACEPYVKIGYSQDVRKRLEVIRPSLPFELTPLGFIKCVSPVEAKAREASIHQQFQEFLVRGEWYRLDTYVRSFICEQTELWPSPGQNRH